MEPFRIQVTDEMLNDLRARLLQTRWPDHVPGMDWKQGTELEWLKRPRVVLGPRVRLACLGAKT